MMTPANTKCIKYIETYQDKLCDVGVGGVYVQKCLYCEVLMIIGTHEKTCPGWHPCSAT